MWKRELLLARIAVVLGGTPGIEEFVRGRGKLQSDKRPVIQLLDEDEAANRSAFDRGRPATAGNYIWLSPGIFVTLKDTGPTNLTVGTDLNALCGLAIKRLFADAELLALLARDDGMRYEGLTTDLREDGSMTGKARVHMSFLYYFTPDEL